MNFLKSVVTFLSILVATISSAYAACPGSPLSNGTTADATQVMSWLNCKAPLDSPSFAGNVGVGTSSPGGQGIGGSPTILQVANAGSSVGALVLSNTSTSSGNVPGVISFASTGLSGSDKRFGEIAAVKLDAGGTNPVGGLVFTTANGSAPSERMRIDNIGNVGIGTTSPIAGLQVSASVTAPTLYNELAGQAASVLGTSLSSTDTWFGIMSNYGTTYGSATLVLEGANAVAGGLAIGSYMTSDNVATLTIGNIISGASPYTTNATKSPFLTILGTSGYVGVGTTSPGQLLEVSGTIRQAGCTTAGTLAVNGSGDIICSSDARLKTIRGPYTAGLDAVSRLNPMLFSYKPTPKSPRETFVHAGFIAQDVRAVIPQASAQQRDGYYSLETTAILAASVNAIKELKVRLESSEAQVIKLQARLDVLERRRNPKTASR